MLRESSKASGKTINPWISVLVSHFPELLKGTLVCVILPNVESLMLNT